MVRVVHRAGSPAFDEEPSTLDQQAWFVHGFRKADCRHRVGVARAARLHEFLRRSE
jgi:hypothetical protein